MSYIFYMPGRAQGKTQMLKEIQKRREEVMAKEMKYLEENEYDIFSDDEVIRVDYCDKLPRIKKVYQNSKGYYVKGQPYWEPSALYLRNYSEKKLKFHQDALDERNRQAALKQVDYKQRIKELEEEQEKLLKQRDELFLWIRGDLKSLKIIFRKDVDIVRFKFFVNDTTANGYNQDILRDYGKKGECRCLTDEEFTNLVGTLRRLENTVEARSWKIDAA